MKSILAANQENWFCTIDFHRHQVHTEPALASVTLYASSTTSITVIILHARHSYLSDHYSRKGCEMNTKWSAKPCIGLWLESLPNSSTTKHMLKMSLLAVTNEYSSECTFTDEYSSECTITDEYSSECTITDEYSSECTILTNQSVYFVNFQTIIYMWSVNCKSLQIHKLICENCKFRPIKTFLTCVLLHLSWEKIPVTDLYKSLRIIFMHFTTLSGIVMT